MKIVHIAHIFVDNYSYQENELAEMHAALGNDVTVISTQDFAGALNFNISQKPKKTTLPYFVNGYKLIRLPLKFKINYRFATYKGLYQKLKEEKPELIFFHEIPYFILFTLAKYKKRNPDCKLFVDYHCAYNNSGQNFISRIFLHKFLYRFIISRTKSYVDIFYHITPGTGKFIKEMYKIPSQKMKLLPLGGNLEKLNLGQSDIIKKQIRTELNIQNDDMIIITGGKIGGTSYSRQTHNLISAFNQIENSKLHLIIFGSISQDYKQILDSYGKQNPRIHYIGWIESIKMYDYFLASDIACFPGGQSVIWQQAICCGLPLICRYWDGDEYLDQGGNIKFLNLPDANEIKTALIEIINNQSILEKMKEVASTVGRDYFSYKRIAQMVTNDYQNLKLGS
jgi:glycosyltransferase involved in cell wall biosynthesis